MARSDVNRTRGVDTGGRQGQGHGYDAARMRGQQQPRETQGMSSSGQTPEFRPRQEPTAEAYASGGKKWLDLLCCREPRPNPPEAIPLSDLSQRSVRVETGHPSTTGGEGLSTAGAEISSIRQDISRIIADNANSTRNLVEFTDDVKERFESYRERLGISSRDYNKMKKGYSNERDRYEAFINPPLDISFGGPSNPGGIAPSRLGLSSYSRETQLVNAAKDFARQLEARLQQS